MATLCSQLMLPASLESPPEYCEREALPGEDVCEEHSKWPDPDHLRDLMIDQQMEDR